MQPSILFVDDEERILSALKRMLRAKRNEWNCCFANSGKEALALLAKNDFAVVISDMRMPEMSGAELLDEVRQKYPGTIRIVLSGFAEEESVLKTILTAHQYLAKPCDKIALEETISRALLLRTFLDKSTAACVVGTMNKLPTLPAIVTELTEEIGNPKTSLKRLSEIVSKDIALTAQTLRVTNSAYFGFPVEVHTPDEAIRFLGIDTFRSIAVTVGIFNEFASTDKDSLRVANLNKNCMSILALVSKICEIENLDERTTKLAISTSALSHIGTLIFMTQWGDIYDDLEKSLDQGGVSLVQGEERAFNVSHPALGAYLLGTWGFPTEVIDAVAFHHAPSESDSFELGPLSILHTSQCLVRKDFDIDAVDNIDPNFLDLDYLGQAGLIDKLPTWDAAAKSLRTPEVN